MSWDNLLIGLLGAVIGGLIGAVGGFFGSRRLQRDIEDGQRKAAGRAILAEMFTNVDRALSAESTRVLHQFLDGTWRSQLPPVAQLLNWANLKNLVDAYDAADRAFENAKDQTRALDDKERALRDRPSAMGEELQRDRQFAQIEKERRKIDAWFRTVAQNWVGAMRILMTTAINPDERPTFENDLRRIEEQLRSANALGELE
jgi:hypothetical protein